MGGLRTFPTVALTLMMITTAAVGQRPPGKGDAANATSAVQPKNATSVSEGEHVFQQNCARCHIPPSGISPRITGTVLRHMRVRASLSEHDERELLRFFNP